VEKEAYAALSALNRFRTWVWGTKVTVLSDHNPLTYLTECAPKSAKLMRWALALQEFNVDFRFRSGKLNVAADVLTRLGPD
jgi:RNase H-like domain found in reverse transcriptase